MSKRLFLTPVLIFLSLSILAQDEKRKSVGFSPFKYYRSSASLESATTIYNYLLDAFEATGRFKILDRMYGTTVVFDELEQTKKEEYMGGKHLVDKGNLEGAQWMVSGQIISAKAIEKEGGFTPSIAFFIRVFDVETGFAVVSEVITPNGRSRINEDDAIKAVKESTNSEFLRGLVKLSSETLLAQSAEAAVSEGMQQMSAHISAFIRERFPIQLQTFQISEPAKDTRLIRALAEAGGTEIEKWQVFEVVQKSEITFGPKTTVERRVKGEVVVIELAGSVLDFYPRKKKDTDFLFELLATANGDVYLQETGQKIVNPIEKNRFVKVLKQY